MGNVYFGGARQLLQFINAKEELFGSVEAPGAGDLFLLYRRYTSHLGLIKGED